MSSLPPYEKRSTFVQSSSLSSEEQSMINDFLRSSKLHPLDKNFEHLVQNFIRENIIPLRADSFKQQYGLDDNSMQLLLPMLQYGNSEQDIAKYIQELIGKQLDIQREDTALDRNVQAQIRNGINPNLSGVQADSTAVQSPVGDFVSSSGFASNGGSVSMSDRFSKVSSDMLRFLTFGLQTYSVVSGNLAQVGSLLAGFADNDVLNAPVTDDGVVTDVDSFIAEQIANRGLKGRKAKIYAREVASRINSLPSILSRLKTGADIEGEKTRLFESKVRNSPDNLANLRDFVTAQLATNAKMQSIDLEIAKRKEEWLIAHPNATAEELDAQLRGVIAESKEKVANASRAQHLDNIAGIQEETAGIERDIKQNEKEVSDAEKSVSILKSQIREKELEGIDYMIDFCKKFEMLDTEFDNYTSMGYSSRRAYDNDKYRYKRYKKYIDEYYRGRKESNNTKISVNTPVGSVSF